MALPANEQYQPRSAASPTRCGAEKQWRITGASPARASRVAKISSVALVSPSGSRAWITIGRSSSIGDLDLGGEGAPLLVRGRRVAVEVEAGLADRPHLLVRARARAISAAAASSKPLASFGWRPTAAKTASWRSALADRRGVRLRVHPDRQHPAHARRGGRGDQLVLARRRRGRGGCGSRSSAGSAYPSPDAGPRRLLPRDLRPRPRRRDAGDPGRGRRAGGAGDGGDGPEGGQLRLRRGRQRGDDAGQPRGLPRAAGSCRGCCATSPAATSRPRVLGTAMPAPLLLAPIGVQKVVHDDGELATARAAAAVGRADDRQHRLPLLARGDRRGRRRGAALVPALLAQRPASSPRSFVERAERGRLRRDRPHRRHLHPRLEAARPAAGLAALPQRHGRRQLLPGPGLPRRRWRRRPRRTRGWRPATSSASRRTRR